jgi:antitoxin CcdA
MRMTKRRLEDPAKPFRYEDASKHIGAGSRIGAKRAVNLSVDERILAVAKDMHINLSQTLEDALLKLTEDERIRRAQEQSRKSVESYNALIERAGVFGEELLDIDDPSV